MWSLLGCSPLGSILVGAFFSLLKKKQANNNKDREKNRNEEKNQIGNY